MPAKKRFKFSDVWEEARVLVWAHRRRLALGLGLMLVNRVVGLVLPATSKFLVDDVIGKGRSDLLPILANGGVMPASAHALQVAGISADPGVYTNSTVLADPEQPVTGQVAQSVAQSIASGYERVGLSVATSFVGPSFQALVAEESPEEARGRVFGLVQGVFLVVGVIGFAIWRSIANFQGHVRAGSELIVETLARQSRAAPPELTEVKAMLPGIPGLSPVRLVEGSPAVGRSLLDVNLRALTGATVLAIHRESGGAVLPTAGEVLRAGDVLALAGPREAIAAAERLLVG